MEGKAALLSNAVRILAGRSHLPSFAFFPLLRALTRVYSPGLALESVGDDTFSSLISIIRCVLHDYLSPIILSLLMAFCLSNSPIHSSMLPISTAGLYPPKCQMYTFFFTMLSSKCGYRQFHNFLAAQNAWHPYISNRIRFFSPKASPATRKPSPFPSWSSLPELPR